MSQSSAYNYADSTRYDVCVSQLLSVHADSTPEFVGLLSSNRVTLLQIARTPASILRPKPVQTVSSNRSCASVPSPRPRLLLDPFCPASRALSSPFSVQVMHMTLPPSTEAALRPAKRILDHYKAWAPKYKMRMPRPCCGYAAAVLRPCC